jgi:hypothetical protein
MGVVNASAISARTASSQPNFWTSHPGTDPENSERAGDASWNQGAVYAWHSGALHFLKAVHTLGRDEPVADDTVREGLCPTYSVDLPNAATQESSGIARDK